MYDSSFYSRFGDSYKVGVVLADDDANTGICAGGNGGPKDVLAYSETSYDDDVLHTQQNQLASTPVGLTQVSLRLHCVQPADGNRCSIVLKRFQVDYYDAANGTPSEALAVVSAS